MTVAERREGLRVYAVNSSYHLKQMIWFRGWTPTHWLLIESPEGLTARCTHASAGPIGKSSRVEIGDERPLTKAMVAQIERAVPGSLAEIMGFDFVWCEGDPGPAVLNKPVSFGVGAYAGEPAAVA